MLERVPFPFGTIVYPLKIWLTGVFVGPLIFLLAGPVFGSGYTIYYNWLTRYLGVVTITALMSVPYFFIVWISYSLLIYFKQPQKLLSGILALVTLVCCCWIILPFSESSFSRIWLYNYWPFVSVYYIPLLVGIVVIKVPDQDPRVSSF